MKTLRILGSFLATACAILLLICLHQSLFSNSMIGSKLIDSFTDKVFWVAFVLGMAGLYLFFAISNWNRELEKTSIFKILALISGISFTIGTIYCIIFGSPW